MISIRKNPEKLRPLTWILATALLMLSFLSCTEHPGNDKIMIGIINLNPKLNSMVEGFKEGLREKKYIEGQNVIYRQMNDAESMDACLRDLKEKHAAIILAVTTPAVAKAQASCRGTGIPIVGISFDPVRSGIVGSLVYKDENTTGIKAGGSVQKALEWLMLITPDIDRIFVPVKLDTKAAELSLDDLKITAEKLDVSLHISELETPGELRRALDSIPEDIDAVFILHSLLIVSNLDSVIETAVEHKLPTVSGSGLYMKGVTISYGQEHRQSGREAAELAHKILKGYPAADLPFKTATFSLGINLANAHRIGLEIPENILKQANIVRTGKTANNN